MKFDTLVHLKISDCYKNFGGHMTQNGRLRWQNTSIENPELAHRAGIHGKTSTSRDLDIHRGDFQKSVSK